MMTFSLPRSFHATSIKHLERGLTLVFGSDGQVSLIDFDNGIASQPPTAGLTFTASNTAGLTLGAPSLSSEPTPVSSIPNLEETSASLTGTSSSTLSSTTSSAASSPVSSSSGPSSAVTDTDTNIPSIPTVYYPTPSPTAVSNPKDHGVGAPFYLAIVLASISFIGCVAALIAWWVRSRARKRDDVELDDPWFHQHDSISNSRSPFADNATGFEKGLHTDAETTTQPYYLPASIVRRSSSNILTVPHTIPEGTSQNSVPRTALAAGGSQNVISRPNPYQDVPPLDTVNSYPRPGTTRLQTGLSVQESTRTLGRLRVANRVPGDVTSGDEGGVNVPRLRYSAGLLPLASIGGPNAVPARESVIQNTEFGQSDQFVQDGGIPMEPSGSATLSWGRRTDTVAALRRARRRTPETTTQTYKSTGYGGHWYPTLDGGPGGTTWQAPAATDRMEDNKTPMNPPSDPLGWKSTLKSSFWQAVDAMTGSRSSDSEPRAENVGGGSRFTPAPQRIASRHSPVSPIIPSQEAESVYELVPPEKHDTSPDTPANSIHPGPGSSLRTGELEVSRIGEDAVDSSPPKVSHLNRDLNMGSHRRHPDSLRTDTGSVYSTDSAAARANLRKYGYGSSIPSSWSVLATRRESQLDLNRAYLTPSRATRSTSPGLLSITPSHLRSELSLASSLVGGRTSMQSKSDLVSSDDSTVRSGKHANRASYAETAVTTTATSSVYSMSRTGTMQSGRSTVGYGSVPPSLMGSMSSSMLSRKKGVTRRKRPRPPARAPSSASSVQSLESAGGLSIRDVAVRRALLERRRRVKEAGGGSSAGAGSSKDGVGVQSQDAGNFLT